MPAFDPVRDAVASSPRVLTHSSPSSSSSKPLSSASAAAPQRRATNLAALLNDAAPPQSPDSPLFTPYTPAAGRPYAGARDYFPPQDVPHAQPEQQQQQPPPSTSSRPISRSSVLDLVSPENVEPASTLSRRRDSTTSYGSAPSQASDSPIGERLPHPLHAQHLPPHPPHPTLPHRRDRSPSPHRSQSRSSARSVHDLLSPAGLAPSALRSLAPPAAFPASSRPGTASTSAVSRSPEQIQSRPSTSSSTAAATGTGATAFPRSTTESPHGLPGGSPQLVPRGFRNLLDSPLGPASETFAHHPPPMESPKSGGGGGSSSILLGGASLDDSPKIVSRGLRHLSSGVGFAAPPALPPKPAPPPFSSSSLAPAPAMSSSASPAAADAAAVGAAGAALPARPKASSKLPYAPSKRLTPPTTVLQPLTAQEAAMYANPANRHGFRRLAKARAVAGTKRGAGAISPGHTEMVDRMAMPPAKRSKDVAMIEDHYNARPDVGKVARQESPIIGLKNFNNWVKSVLIHRFAHPALQATPGGREPALRYTGSGGGRGGQFRQNGGKVLDMGCGKGGDLQKWARAPVKEFVGCDIAAVSVEQARGRWSELRTPRFDATFVALDCYANSLSTVLAPAKLARQFDVVSMQFCMHYAFENLQKARQMLDNASRWLRKGGIFVGTVPNSEFLLSHLASLPPDATELEWGNSVYRIRFEERTHASPFGHRYSFFLRDAVDDVPEYVVPWDTFTAMAAEHGLHCVYRQEFHHVFQEHEHHKEFGPLLLRMKVVDENGESAMDEDQWEAANVYLAFAFEKR